MTKLCYELVGLDCPNCAEKIAVRVNSLDIVDSANIDFIHKKLTVKHNHNNDNEVLSQVENIVHQLEPDVIVREYNKQANNAEEEESHVFDIVRLSIGTVLLGISFFVKNEFASGIVALCAYLIAGYDVIFSAFRNLFKGEAFDESLLMTIATVGAIALKDFSEAAAVMLFFQVGELFEDIAVERSRKSITKLMELKPESASVEKNGEIVEMSPDDVQTGDIIVVKPGERIALDGEVFSGESQLDTSALTGEFLPVEVKTGDKVLSGSSNLNGLIKIKVTSTFGESAVSKILDMVENSAEKKAKTEKFITRFARIYTPAVVAAALLLVFVPSFVFGFDEFSTWLYRGLLFLVISCPCALVISVPLSFFAGIGGASRNGILIKGAKSIEALSKCKTLAVDKTGTLTKGKFAVTDIKPVGISENELIEYAAYAEMNSSHPIALSIIEHYGKKPDISRISELSEIAGRGISCKLDGKIILCGKRSLLEENGISSPETESIYTVVYVAIDNTFVGIITLGDEIKEDSLKAVKALKAQGVNTVLLTGDREETAKAVADKVGISEYYSSLLPENKVERVESLIADENKRLVAFAGDGINDAPVIAGADVGIAMGGLGSDIAIEAADVVLMNDNPYSISKAITISRKSMKIVRENIVFALGVKLAIMVLGAVGIAGMWAAVFADVGVAFLAILNALRCGRIK